MKYPLIVSDFDGTLLRSDGSIGERTKDAIENHCRGGGIFAVCTGRMEGSILPEVRALGLKGLVVSFNGSVVTDIQTGNRLRFECFPKSDAVFVSEKLQSHGLRIHAYTAETLFVNYSDELLFSYERITGVKSVFVADMTEFIRSTDLPLHKLVVMTEAEKQAEVFEWVKGEFKDRYYVTTSASVLVEISGKGQDKGNAVEFLCRHYGIPLSQSIALGDQRNDLPMLERAGLGIAVANANETVKRLADLVTVSNNEDAVGMIIEQYGLGEKHHE